MKKADGKLHSYELVLAIIVAAGSGTSVLAMHPPDARVDILSLTLRVYDSAPENRSTLLAAETEATRILAQPGVNSRWTDCPTSRGESSNYPSCQPLWQVNDYVLKVIPEAKAALLGKSDDAVGATPACSIGPYCTAIIFYDRVERMVSGSTAAAPVLLGRTMAHEIGHLLLGANSHSPTGIMRDCWSLHELRVNAGPDMLFTREQARRMKIRLSQPQESSEADAHDARGEPREVGSGARTP